MRLAYGLILLFIAAVLLMFGCDLIGPVDSGSPENGGEEDPVDGNGEESSDGMTAAWARTVTTGDSWSFFESVAVDAGGNVYAAGFISGTGTYTFGPEVTAAGSSEHHNAVLVKYDNAGNAKWARTVNTGNDYSAFHSVAVDAGGNVYAAGYVSGIETYTFGPGVTVEGSSTVWNVVLVKYNTAGNAQWARTVETNFETDLYSGFMSVLVGSDGSVYAAGYVHGAGATFGPDVWTLGSNLDGNTVLVKYDSAGNAQWARTVSTGNDRSAFDSVAVDAGGNLYAGGYIYGTDTYTFGPEVTAAGSSEHHNAVLVKYDSAGNAQWARTVSSGDLASRFHSVAVTGGEKVYAAGRISGSGTYTFGPGVTVAGSSAVYNVALLKYDLAGTAHWARTVSTGSDWSAFHSVAVDAGGNVYASGFIVGSDTYTFGPGVATEGSSHEENAVFVKYDNSGNAEWIRTASSGDPGSASIFSSLAIDGSGDLYVSGAMAGSETYTFGPGVTAAGTSDRSNVVLVQYSE